MKFATGTLLFTFVIFLNSIGLSLQVGYRQQEVNNDGFITASQNQIFERLSQNIPPEAQQNPVRPQNQPPRHDPALAYNNLPSNSAPYAYRNRHNNLQNNQQHGQNYLNNFSPPRHEHNPLGFGSSDSCLQFRQQEGRNSVRPAGPIQIFQEPRQNNSPVVRHNPVPSNNPSNANHRHHNNLQNNQQHEQYYPNNFSPPRHAHNPLGFAQPDILNQSSFTTPRP